MTIAPLTINPQQAYSELDFSPLMRLGDQMRQQQQANTLASLQNSVGAQTPSINPPTGKFDNSTDLMANHGPNVQSWYDFARKPADQGGLGFSHEQAAAAVANLQSESGSNIPSWGVTGDQGTAHGAAQWRLDRLDNLQRFAAAKGMDPRSTEAQQAFMRHEYVGDPSEGYGGGSKRSAYEAVRSATTPQAAATAINHLYEVSADRSGQREAAAARNALMLKPLNLLPH